MTTNSASTGKNLLKELRHQMDVSQKEMAKLLSIDRTYLSRIENGHQEPSLRLLKSAKLIHEKLKEDSSELQNERATPEVGDLEQVAADCIAHISKYACLCLTRKPERLHWLREELEDKFPLSYFAHRQKEASTREPPSFS